MTNCSIKYEPSTSATQSIFSTVYAAKPDLHCVDVFNLGYGRLVDGTKVAFDLFIQAGPLDHRIKHVGQHMVWSPLVATLLAAVRGHHPDWHDCHLSPSLLEGQSIRVITEIKLDGTGDRHLSLAYRQTIALLDSLTALYLGRDGVSLLFSR